MRGLRGDVSDWIGKVGVYETFEPSGVIAKFVWIAVFAMIAVVAIFV